MPVPALTVVIRTLGRDGRLGDALSSLAQQTSRDFEVVIVDMSGDGVQPIVARFAADVPGVRRLPLRPSSRPLALNAGIAAARSPLVSILDDDNMYDPNHVSLLVQALDDPTVDYVYSGVRHATYSPDGVLIESHDVAVPFDFKRLLLSNFIYATGSAYRKAIWHRVGGYDERFVVFEDWDFLIRVARTGTVRHIPVVSGESRKFTGLAGVSSFDLEIDAVRRCHAGIHWTHRRLFDADARDRLKTVYEGHCRRRHPARRGFLTNTLAGWRLEFGWDLLAWWAGNLRMADEGTLG